MQHERSYINYGKRWCNLALTIIAIATTAYMIGPCSESNPKPYNNNHGHETTPNQYKLPDSPKPGSDDTIRTASINSLIRK